MNKESENQSIQNADKLNNDDSLSWTRISKDDLLRGENAESEEQKPQSSLEEMFQIDFSFLDRSDAAVLENAKKGAQMSEQQAENPKEEFAEEVMPEPETEPEPEPVEEPETEPEIEFELIAEEEPFLPPTEFAEPEQILNITETETIVSEAEDTKAEDTKAEDTEAPVAVVAAVSGTEAAAELSAEVTKTAAPAVKPKKQKKAEEAGEKKVKEKKVKVSAAERKAQREARELAELTADEDAFNEKVHKRNVKNSILNAIMLVSVGVFLICAIELGVYSYQSIRYKASMDKIKDAIHGGISVDLSEKLNNMKQDNGDVLVFPDEEAYEVMQATKKEEIGNAWAEKYAYLVENNSDCFGYIEIPDTTLSYPVMFTPEKYDFYLWKNFSGEHETRGTPFMDEATKLGKSQNYLIYGHNMTDNSAFGTLKRYLEKAYYQKHKYIYFNTSVSEGVYEVMAVVKTKVFSVEDKCFKYYKYGGVLTEKEFDTYVSEVLKQSVYKTGVTASWGDQLITLSTCNHYTEMGRLIIVAKRIL